MTRHFVVSSAVIFGLMHFATLACNAAEPGPGPALGAGSSFGAGLLTPPRASTEGLPRDPGDLRSMMWSGQETAPQRGETAPQPSTCCAEWTDPSTGLAVSQQRNWIPQLRCVAITTTIANRGRVPVRASGIDLADWSFRIAVDSDALRYPEL